MTVSSLIRALVALLVVLMLGCSSGPELAPPACDHDGDRCSVSIDSQGRMSELYCPRCEDPVWRSSAPEVEVACVGTSSHMVLFKKGEPAKRAKGGFGNAQGQPVFGAPVRVTGVPTDGYVLTYDSGTGTWRAEAGGGGGGSQTPWTSNIDAAGYDLTDVGNLTVPAGDLTVSGTFFLEGTVTIDGGHTEGGATYSEGTLRGSNLVSRDNETTLQIYGISGLSGAEGATVEVRGGAGHGQSSSNGGRLRTEGGGVAGSGGAASLRAGNGGAGSGGGTLELSGGNGNADTVQPGGIILGGGGAADPGNVRLQVVGEDAVTIDYDTGYEAGLTTFLGPARVNGEFPFAFLGAGVDNEGVELSVDGVRTLSLRDEDGTARDMTIQATGGLRLKADSGLHSFFPSDLIPVTDATATGVLTIDVHGGLAGVYGGVIEATVFATDGTERQAITQRITFAAVDTGSFTTDVDVTAGSIASSSGTLTATWDMTTAAGVITLRCTADTSLTVGPPALYVQVRVLSSNTANQAP
jgi:hypothetical protein